MTCLLNSTLKLLWFLMARSFLPSIIGHLTLPNLPNPLCPVSGVHSKRSKIVLGLVAIIVITALLITGCSGGPTTTQPTITQPTTTKPTTTQPTTKPPTTTPKPTDTVAPTVNSTSPDNNAEDIMVNTTITATFSEAMDTTSITTGFTLKDDNDDVISGTVTYTDTTATFTPSADMDYSTTYTATITTEVQDKAGNAMSTDYTWNFTTRDAGILEGAINYTGPYPTPADVSYRDTDGQIATVTAYPGQVQVFFDSATSLSEAETSIQANGGTIIGKIPLTGYYLVQVPEGMEADFTTAIQQDSNVKLSLPNLALSFSQDGVVINEDFVTTSIPVPLNVTGAVAIDSGAHAQEVQQAAEEGGVPINHIVDVKNVLDNSGCFSADKAALTLTAIIQGTSIFNPGNLAYINLSYNSGSRVNGVWVDYTTLSTAEQRAQAIRNCKSDFLEKFQAVNMLPDDLRQQLVMSLSAGNCNMPIGQSLQEIRNAFPELVPIIRDNITIYSTTLTTTPGERFPTGNFANTADDKDVVTINNSKAAEGTSCAAPAGLAYTMQAASEAGGLTAAQANMAIKLAEYTNATGQLNKGEAIEIAESEKHIGKPLERGKRNRGASYYGDVASGGK